MFMKHLLVFLNKIITFVRYDNEKVKIVNVHIDTIRVQFWVIMLHPRRQLRNKTLSWDVEHPSIHRICNGQRNIARFIY